MAEYATQIHAPAVRPAADRPPSSRAHRSARPALPAGFHGPSPGRAVQPKIPAPLEGVRLRSYATLLLIDVLAVAGGFLIANALWFGDAFAEAGLNYMAMFLPVFLAIAFSQNAYSVDALESPRVGVFKALRALAVAGCALLLALFYAKISAVMSRAVFGMGLVSAATLLVLMRHRFGHLLGRRHCWRFQNDVLLVDHATPAPDHATDIVYAADAGLNPLRNDPAMADRIGGLLGGYDRVILNCSPERRMLWVRYLKGLGIDVEVLTPELDYLGALSLRRSESGSAVLVAAGPLGVRERFVKRGLDVAVATAMMIFFAPLFLCVALLIKADSPGPVLFRQWRLGRGNRPFQLLKFRTMRTEACDAAGVQSASRNDSRVTKIGALLRRTSIDELPQLWNVLRGDMSIVGPRPHAVCSTAEDDLFWDIDDRYWHRGAVKPGLTGLAQVRGFRGATSTRKDLTDRVQADLEYLANWSVATDLTIIARTLRVLVHPNAY